MSNVLDRQQELKDRVAELQRAKGLSFVQAWASLERDEPALFSEPDYPATPMIDFVQTLSPELRAKLAKLPPVFRYTPGIAARTPAKSLREAAGLPELVKAKKPVTDSEPVLVYATHEADLAKITDLATKKMAELGVDREVAVELVHDERPELFAEMDQKAEAQARADQIKARIRAMQTTHPDWNFRTCWQKLQSQSPSLFDGLD